MKTEFSKWLLSELEKRNMSQSELSRKSNISTGQISHLVSGQRGAESKTLLAIAQALKIPAEEIYRAAGKLPPEIQSDQTTKEGTYLLQKLDQEERENAVKHLRLCVKIQEENKKGKGKKQ